MNTLGYFLCCSKGVKNPFEVQEGRCDFPRDAVEKGRLEGRTSWFFSSRGRFLSRYDGDLRDPLVWPQERPVSMQVARDLLRFLFCGFPVLSPRLELRLEPEVSSKLTTWILGSLWSLHPGIILVLSVGKHIQFPPDL